MRVLQDDAKSRMKILLMFLMIQLLFLSYTAFFGKGKLYLQVAVMIIPFSLLALFIVEKIQGDQFLVIWTTVLIQCGFMVQAMTNEYDGIKRNLIKCMVAVLLAFSVGILYRFLASFLASEKGLFLILISHIVLGLLMIAKGQMIGSGSAQGAVLNLRIGPITIQPFEIMKLTYVFILAGLLCKEEYQSKHFLGMNRRLAVVLISVVTAGILVICGELGSLLILILTGGTLFLLYGKSRIALKYLILFSVILGLGLLILIIYQHEQIPLLEKLYSRFFSMLEPERYAQTSGFQYLQMKKALTIGGLFGPDTFRYITTLSNESNDLIFCKLVQVCGIIMGIFVILMYYLLFLEGKRVAEMGKTLYYKGLTFGIILLITYESLIHISYSVGLFPITGIPLYFMSSGFTSMTVGLIMIAMILVISSGLAERSGYYEKVRNRRY